MTQETLDPKAAAPQDESQEKKEDISTPEHALKTVSDMEAALEAVLFAAGYPVPYKKIGEVLGLSAADVRTLAEHAAEKYNHADANRGIQMLLFPDTVQLCTREEFAPYIREVLGVRRGGNLSAASMEVLAIVAYNQPVTRTFIDTVRGVDSSYAVNSLLDKELIRAVGRLEAVGRPMLYGTTDKFLRVFGISSLEELPATEALAVAAELESQQNAQAEKQHSPASDELPDAAAAEADTPVESTDTIE
jgi:segregation and condensation protein B